MKKELKNYSNTIKFVVKEEILPKIPGLNLELRSLLYDVFCHYVPNKERAFIVNRISICYNIDKSISALLETGLELIFAAYYLRDDLLDDASTILGRRVDKLSAKYFSVLADIMNEIGNIQIAHFCSKNGKPLEEFVFMGFLCLSYGQLQGLGSNVGTKEYLDVAYNKNGAMMEYALKMLLPLLPLNDGKVLVDFAADFGVSSQIRNDVEDFLRNDKDSLFKDIKTNQVNFVLSAYYDRTNRFFDKSFVNLNEAEEVIDVLSTDLCFAYQFLFTIKEEMLKKLSILSNLQCKKELMEITDFIISL